jgi:hypothetical protein
VLPDERLEALQARFLRFAREAGGRSPLYARLSRDLAAHADAVALLTVAPPAQRRPSLLLAAVHDLLLRAAEGPDGVPAAATTRGDHAAAARAALAAYYPSVGGDRAPDAAAVHRFLAVLATHPDAVEHRLRTRATQTNEVGRAAALWPGICEVTAALGRRPLVLVELGTSAGLLLHLDRYAHRYGDARAGDAASPVRLAPALHGVVPPLAPVPTVVGRVGIDLAPLEPTDPDDRAWLRACVWPEDVDRLTRLDAALTVAGRHTDVRTVAGDLVVALPEVLRTVPAEAVPCVWHSAALAYLGTDAREAVARILASVGRRRDLAVLSLEGPFVAPFPALSAAARPAAPDEEHFLLGATTWRAGEREDRLLARVQPHGVWLQWLAPTGDGEPFGTER